MVSLNPLHYINKYNHMFGDTLASQLEFLGITDPAVDPDGVREIAKKWRALATGLEDASGDAERALAGLVWEGKTAKAFHKRAKETRKHATDMAHSLRKGAKALDKFADQAHELISEIGVMLEEIEEFELAGLALDVLTGGASTVVATLMSTERALKVVALVGRIEEEGTALGSVIRGVLEVIRGLERALKALKDIKAVATVGKMAKDGMEFSAFATALEDPGAFKDPSRLAGLLTEGALMGIGGGLLGKALGKGLKRLKPSDLSALAKSLGLGGSDLSKLKLEPAEGDKLAAEIRAAEKELKLDPIDVATGEMLLPQTDVQLPGALPLLLERTHISSYRWGGWFGPSWASTLDQRLQATDDSITYATADGARLTYPLLESGAGEPVHAGTNKALPMSWDMETDGAVRVSDPASGVAYLFHTPQPIDDGEAVDLPLQAIVDGNGQRIIIRYADDGTPTEIVHPGGYRIALDRHPTLPRISALRLLDNEHPDGRGTTLVSYGYSEEGHLTEVLNSSGLPTRFTYDEAGRITSWTDRNGCVYHYIYDERGRVVRTDGSGGFLAGTLSYDDATRTTTVTNSLGHTTRYEHSRSYRLIRETSPLGHTRHQEWNAEHQLIAVTDEQGNTTRCSYDDHGRVLSVVGPDGTETRCTYNEAGLPAALTGPGGATWRQEYDERGNRTALSDPAGVTTHFTYNSSGHRTSVTDPLGNTTHLRCSSAGLPYEVIDPLGAVTRYERDAFGRTSAITDALGNVTRFEWTVEGKLARRTSPDGSRESWEYDGEGNCVTHMDSGGGVTHFEYTHFDLVAVRTDPDGTRYEFTHDTDLHLIRVTNPQNRSWNYEYDPAGRIRSEKDFDGRILSYTYSPAGHLTSRTNAMGQVTRYEHDVLGRTLRKDADGAVTTFEYDSTGLLIQAANSHATLTLEYDAAGRVVAESVNGRTSTYTYDVAGRRTSRTTPSGFTSCWNYDAAGRPTTLLNGAGRTLAFEYDPAGRELACRIGEIARLANTFDEQGRLTGQSVLATGGSTVQQRRYSYRGDGSLVGIDDQLNGPRRFDVDIAGRITASHARGWSERYVYDELGNQTDADWPSIHPGHEAIGGRAYQGTQITRAGSVRYEHDAQGRITLRQKSRLSRTPDTWRYGWDAEDHLVSVRTPDGISWRYLYDPFGRRIAKQRLASDGTTVAEQTDFAWDGTTLCEQTTQSAELTPPVTVTWDHNGVRPMAQTERIITTDTPQVEIDSRFFAIVTDLVGTPTELLGEDGDFAWRARSSLWGITTWSSRSTTYTPLRFPGQYYDPESGLHYNYFRHYDPETARYLSQDPLGLAPAGNPRAYVVNPYTWIDELGLAPGTCPLTGQQIDPKGYTSLFEMELDRADFGKSRKVHFSRANTALDAAIKADPELGAYLEQFSPGIAGQVSSKGGRKVPVGHTWQHEPAANAGGREGVMRLVPTYQHTPGTPWWDVLHPGYSGGYAEWGIPNGAPPNRVRRR
ncbi:DUF6531 domain-containing protein [Streptomyces lutosisoli]|uniref:DUF6531 domain-containing protein n=1 Tax=Streptomyces lutosisoli TaxID=2665721 RepID=UPI00361F0672